MHKLARHLARPSALTHLTRLQHPHHYAALRPQYWRSMSSASGKSPGDRFDRLAARLKPGLGEDDLAKTIAELVASTGSQARLESLGPIFQKCMEGLNRKEVDKLVEQYLMNPPEELILDATSELEEQNQNLEENPPREKHVMSKEEAELYFPEELPIGSPVDELVLQVSTPIARQVLEGLSYEEQVEFRSLMLRLYTPYGGEDIQALAEIKSLLEAHGLEIKYTVRPAPVEETLEGTQAIDPVNLAQHAAVDEELAKPVAETVKEAKPEPYPDLMTPDPLLDSRDVMDFPPTKTNKYTNRVTIRNHSSIFHESMAAKGFDFADEDWKPSTTDETEEQLASTDNLPLTPQQLRRLYRFPLASRRITQQTAKGKIHRQFVLMIVGNGNGLVGLGQGKDDDHSRAESKAFAEAVRNMDWVERFEGRTIWTDMESKLGATRVIMRPRPVGFGLRCNPWLHQVLKAAGIKDISAKVWGSRNPINVIKTAMRMLQAGHAPLAMGDGIGGPGKKLNKGCGLRSKSEVERERGRPLISLRK